MIVKLTVPNRVQSESVVQLQPGNNPELDAQLFLQARSEARSQAMGSRAVKREPRLAWDALAGIYGGEDGLREAIEAIKQVAEEGTQLAEVVELAERYLAGWRPEAF